MNKLFFNDSLGLKLNPTQVVQEIINFININPHRCYKVIIGTDSEAAQKKGVDFVTAIVVYRVGNGGRYFWRRIKSLNKYFSLRQRITDEVLMSLEIAKNLLHTMKKFKMPPIDFEIHADIGENGDTRTMIQELVGMIRANNFEVKTKPESYAASKVADRHL